MTDALLTEPDQKEALSRAFAHAIAAGAGYATAIYDLDRDGIDLRIQSGEAMRPALELQLKATAGLGEPIDGCFCFRLPRRNYDLLRIETQTPRLLVVLDLPKDPTQWITVATDKLVLRRGAYWLNLAGSEETNNQTSVTVRIPQANLFNVDNLRSLMEQSREGRIMR